MENKIIAEDFMTKYVISVPPDATMQDLLRVFLRHVVGAIPVVGADNELLGIVSEGDMLYKKVTPRTPRYMELLGANVYYSGFGRYERSFRKLLATTAEEIMTKDVRCVVPETDMETITSLMIDEHLKSVPVVDKKPDGKSVSRLVGIITRHDILNAIAASEAEQLRYQHQNEGEEHR